MARARLAKVLAVMSLIGGSLGVGACVEAEGMVYAYGLAGGPDLDDCDEVFSAAANVQRIIRGEDGAFIDLNTTSICLQNKIKSNRLNGVETSNVILYEYDISFSNGTSRTQATTNVIPADAADGSAGLEGGQLNKSITIFDADGLNTAYADAEGAGGQTETVAGIVFRGRTTGGIDIDTPEFFFPVEVFAPFTCFCDPPPGQEFSACGQDILDVVDLCPM